jgi:signal peptidase II
MFKRHLLIALVVFAIDRLTKWIVVRTIVLEDAVPVIPGFFRLTHLENPGAAFSLFAESSSPSKMWLLIGFSLAALAVVALLLWRDRNQFNSATLALSLILGGTLGNLLDRLVDGNVTDFLDFYLGLHHWPPFNVADSAIVIGAFLLMMRMMGTGKPSPAVD